MCCQLRMSSKEPVHFADVNFSLHVFTSIKLAIRIQAKVLRCVCGFYSFAIDGNCSLFVTFNSPCLDPVG